MSSKKLDTAGVMNELKGQSAFFKKEDTSLSGEITVDKLGERTPVRPTGRSTERSQPEAITKQNRITRRYSFEAYDDQVRELKMISMQAGIEGMNIPISEMIRDAIDSYLAKRRDRE